MVFPVPGGPASRRLCEPAAAISRARRARSCLAALVCFAPAADCLALIAEARDRVHERFGVVLEHEVCFLGPIELPPLRR